MGAERWEYYVPFRSDMQEVLSDLHRAVFESGEYQHPGVGTGFFDEIGFFDGDNSEKIEMLAQWSSRYPRSLCSGRRVLHNRLQGR